MANFKAPYKIAPERSDYHITGASGALTTVAADAAVWSMQWTSASLICVVKRVGISLGVTTAYGTAQPTAYGLYFARSYTVADSGGTALTLTTNNGKLDTTFPTTAVGDMRISTTGALTGGTRTLDAQALDVATFGTNALGLAFNWDFQFGGSDEKSQIILRQDEGLVLNNMILMGATGVVKLYVTVEWAEVDKGSVR